MISAIDISTSALVAQRARLDVVSGNIANISTVKNEDGELIPYQPRHVIFETDEEMATESGGVGVKVASVEIEDVEPNYRLDPTSPLAQKTGPKKGHVAYPNINLTEEFVDALQATRAYEANIGVMEITKDLAAGTLRILV